MDLLSIDSGAFQLLAYLVDIGHQGRLAGLDADGIPYRANIEALVARKYVALADSVITVTATGLEYVDDVRTVWDAMVDRIEVAQPLEVQVNRPYSAIRKPSPAIPYRPGSMDYKDIPSLNFGVRKARSGEVLE